MLIVGAVLAAGAGTRMGRPKAEVLAGAARLLDRSVQALHDGGCDPVLAVVRPGTEVSGARAVINAAPERGMRSSLALAVGSADDLGADALVITLVDLPGVGAQAVRAVITAWRPGRIARATFGGRPGHPIAMEPALWRAALAMADADGGARTFLRRHPELVDDVAAPGDPSDLDTPADLARWLTEQDR